MPAGFSCWTQLCADAGAEVGMKCPAWWLLQVNNKRGQQKDSFPQLPALTIFSTLNEGKGSMFRVNLIDVAVQLQGAGAWRKGGGGNECVSMRK